MCEKINLKDKHNNARQNCIITEKHECSIKIKLTSLIVVTCADLSLSNGRVSYNTGSVNGGFPVDTVVSFHCNNGYSLSGSSSRTCQTSGNWDQSTSTCTYVPPPPPPPPPPSPPPSTTPPPQGKIILISLISI